MATTHDHQPLRHRSLREVVADEIVARILDGRWPAGSHLVEQDIATEMGVSRNTVREAAQDVAATGLITVVPRRGTFVAEIDHRDLLELLEVRTVLESLASSRAARLHTADDLAEIERTVADGTAAAARDDIVAEAACHHRFLAAIDAAAHSAHLAAALEPVRRKSDLIYTLLAIERRRVSWDDHDAMAAAIASGDEERAATTATLHLRSLRTELERDLTDPT